MRAERLPILLRKTYNKILIALTPMLSKGKRIYAKIPKATEKQTLTKILVTLNISILLLAIAILALTLGLPHSPPGNSYQTPISGNTTQTTNSTNSNNSLPSQQESPASSGSGSNIKVEPSPSNNSSQQQPASILKLGVYDGDPLGNQSVNLSAIDWSVGGPILPGQSRNSSVVYFRNEGNVPVTLYLASQTWAFKDYKGDNLSQDFQQYFSLTWDSEGTVLQVNQVRPAVFTLTVSPNITDVASFSFDMVVTLSY